MRKLVKYKRTWTDTRARWKAHAKRLYCRLHSNRDSNYLPAEKEHKSLIWIFPKVARCFLHRNQFFHHHGPAFPTNPERNVAFLADLITIFRDVKRPRNSASGWPKHDRMFES